MIPLIAIFLFGAVVGILIRNQGIMRDERRYLTSLENTHSDYAALDRLRRDASLSALRHAMQNSAIVDTHRDGQDRETGLGS